MAIKAITTDSFRDDVLKTRKPVLIKFWAPLLLFINGAVAGFLIDPSSEKEIDVFLRKMLGLNAGGLYGKYV